jgi:hypothetical protein
MRTPPGTVPVQQNSQLPPDQTAAKKSGGNGGDVEPPAADDTATKSPGKPPTAAVTPGKSVQSEIHSVESDNFSEESSVDGISDVQEDPRSPTTNADVSFDELFPFVTDKQQKSPKNKKKAKSSGRSIFLETYKDFKTYMKGTKLKKMPLIEHKKAAGKIYIDKDGKSSDTSISILHSKLTCRCFLNHPRGLHETNRREQKSIRRSTQSTGSATRYTANITRD